MLYAIASISPLRAFPLEGNAKRGSVLVSDYRAQFGNISACLPPSERQA